MTQPRGLRRFLPYVLAGLVLVVGSAWLLRVELLLFGVSRVGRMDVAPHRAVEWAKGPAQAALPPSDRPPNIIFILADDLGINDLSTFGGGGTNPITTLVVKLMIPGV